MAKSNNWPRRRLALPYDSITAVVRLSPTLLICSCLAPGEDVPALAGITRFRHHGTRRSGGGAVSALALQEIQNAQLTSLPTGSATRGRDEGNPRKFYVGI